VLARFWPGGCAVKCKKIRPRVVVVEKVQTVVDQVQKSKRTRSESSQGPDLDAPSLYINRELSFLEFNQRVLDQARDDRHPLLDRLRFLAIVSSNIEEFFMVRVSDLQDQVDQKLEEMPPDGMTPAQQLAAIRKRVTTLFEQQRRVLCAELLPELEARGICILSLDAMSKSQRAALHTYFEEEIFPVLTPLAVDPGHPFPHISNLSVNLAVELAGEGSETRFARVKIPDSMSRLVHLEGVLDQPKDGKKARSTFVWLDEIVAANLPSLFPGVPVLGSHTFQVVRDADIEIHEEEGADLRRRMEMSLMQRRLGEAVRLTVENSMPDGTRRLLAKGLGLEMDSVYAVDKPLGLESLMQLSSLDRPDLKYPVLVPRLPSAMASGESMPSILDRQDMLVHLPYDSFAPVLELLTSSSRDSKVLAIKQTLYRVGADAPAVRALLDAVNQGKQVAVLVELKARFDEASNIEWARELERAGVHVTYGFLDLKTHAKIALVVRKDRSGIQRYVHLSTGNYNVGTARAYTDVGLFTAHPDFGADATDLFNYLTGYSQQKTYRQFLVAPVNLRQGLLDRIEREIETQVQHGNGHLVFKTNSLVDQEFIRALYRASQVGCRVELIVRGICCLRPGLPNVSENVRVISLVGRFLEHSRMFYFGNNGDPELYCGSADLMPRNLDHRVEVLFPILDPGIRDQAMRTILEPQLRDTVNAWELRSNGSYRKVHPADGEQGFDSQAWSVANSRD